MPTQVDPHAAPAEVRPPHVTALPEGRIVNCPLPQRSRRVAPLLLGLAIGAVLWLAIGLFSWHFFR
jgi:hypothetical protein